MATNTINAEMLKKMFLAGAANIEAKKEYINELNVFPVPDGDTGTNMSLTIMAAAKEVSNLTDLKMSTLAKAISSGSLRGARGNSGVILSQLFRGFTKIIRDHEELDVHLLAEACQKAKETAYKAVMKPKEGTILTVARGIGDRAIELAHSTSDLEVFFPQLIKHAEHVLSKTPDMLPVLKQAGVVDSGGQGLLEIIKGAYDGFLGKEIDYTFEMPHISKNLTTSSGTSAHIEFGYCTEFIILVKKHFTEHNEIEMKRYLESIGDSIVCVADDEIVKIHVHTNSPGLAIQKALTYGELSRIKIDNMREEHEEKLIKDAEKLASQTLEKEVGFIAVSLGTGLNSIFKELGVDYIIEGGQTMNPSTEDVLNAIDKVNAKTIFLFPNNKNIILAANQAKDLTNNKNIIVIPTKTIPQGITAIINFMPEKDVKSNEITMISEIQNVKTGQVTYAVRDTTIDGKVIHQGDIMGIGDTGILSIGKSIDKATMKLLSHLVNAQSELISIYYGDGISETDAKRLSEEIESLYPEVDVDMHFGGQPIYYYVLAVE
ncbi:MAG: DAK2 domain-containing protein [Lachnospiraceae bacterium]